MVLNFIFFAERLRDLQGSCVQHCSERTSE